MFTILLILGQSDCVLASCSAFTPADAQSERGCCLVAAAARLWLPAVKSGSGEGVHAGESARHVAAGQETLLPAWPAGFIS